MVRATAWLSFAMGQTAVPLLLVPVACGLLLYVQIRLGLAHEAIQGWLDPHVAFTPAGLAITVVLGLAALVQSFLAIRLVPLGVRLLANDGRAGTRANTRARQLVLVNGAILAVALLLGSMMPTLVRPVLRATLEWTALRPVAGYAIVSLLYAALLGRCTVALGARSKK
jgi:hypothetical protein